ncbi:activating signal cointegrator 1 complex subunit 1 [Diorhabda carinulata]|uniref:activating signal cointegrator 1 complex subunit 1 n=1 Tax=Diorhabda carinulata TaxID=1163345 RepID=UPI0025A04853|nr:activating signal cointegrator 1 complex subunit 1 [Diorhabda carinulata]
MEKMNGIRMKTIGIKKPIRMWIDGKCFNIKHFNGKQRQTVSPHPLTGTSDFENYDMYNIDFDTLEDGTLYTSFELPQLYYTKLKCNDFFDLNLLKNKTKTTISVPSYGNNRKLIISGVEDNIRDALIELHSVIGYIRDRSLPLQFTSIPLVNEEIRSNFENFKSEILNDTSLRGVEESIFQSPLKLHLTINILVLLNDREKNEAVLALEEFNENVLKPLKQKNGELKIHVAGIDCMNGNYKKVDVLYAKAKIYNETEEISLQDIANQLSEHFYQKGLLKQHQEQIKLHMTLMNTKYRNSKKKWAKRVNFDATKIMEKYKDYEFGKCDFNTVHISNMSSLGEDGFYESLTSVVI